MIRFYRSESERPVSAAPQLPADIEIRLWRPGTDGLPFHREALARNLAWFAFTRLGLFANREFAELSLWRDRRLLHRLVVTPRWLRFPFMDADDLQIGDLWTAPQERGKGLARAAIAAAHARLGAPGRRFWYLADETNAASVGLIESCDYSFIGTGRRTAPLGLRPVGSFRLDERPA